MSNATLQPLGYATKADQSIDAWQLLRIAVILWASFVLLRHASYWGAIAIERPAPVMVNARGVAIVSAARSFPVEASLEAVVLLVALATAITCPSPQKNAVRALALAGIAFVILVLIDLTMTLARGMFAPSARDGLQLIWTIVSRLQLLVVPILCGIYALRFVPRAM